jgi:hypothetical protein
MSRRRRPVIVRLPQPLVLAEPPTWLGAGAYRVALWLMHHATTVPCGHYYGFYSHIVRIADVDAEHDLACSRRDLVRWLAEIAAKESVSLSCRDRRDFWRICEQWEDGYLKPADISSPMFTHFDVNDGTVSFRLGWGFEDAFASLKQHYAGNGKYAAYRRYRYARIPLAELAVMKQNMVACRLFGIGVMNRTWCVADFDPGRLARICGCARKRDDTPTIWSYATPSLRCATARKRRAC